ncbi:hypothetical protein DIS24_g5077 [Lasiodiplodia hormozganensis]|uniref:Uncharacterized protein n=1 Tax=Lasiodiplodia hormozganensis TaxID=869390 RepID=A0AA40CWY4_9PEZI|nr:hypothetical protein DIS24_g5077 [Lasiodiplodia hormozganensis]
MAHEPPSPKSARKSNTENGAPPSSSSSSPAPSRHHDGSTSSGRRPMIDSYRPQREPHRASPSLGPRPFDNSERPALDSYRSPSSRMGGYGPSQRKTQDSPSRASDSEPSRKKQYTGRETRETSPLPDRLPRYSPSSPTASRSRHAQDVHYHNDAYADAARGRRASEPSLADTYRRHGLRSFRPRTPSPTRVTERSLLPERRRAYDDGTASPQQPRRFSHHYHSSPRKRSPPPRRPFSPSDPEPSSNSPAAHSDPVVRRGSGSAVANPKHLSPSECTSGRFIWVKRLPGANPAAAAASIGQGWRCHPGVIVDEDGEHHAYVATTTSWKDFRGLHNKFSGVAHGDRRLEFERSFCLVANAAVSAKRLASNPEHIPVVRIEGAEVFEQETYIDGRAVRRVRKDELCKYIKKGTTEEAFVTAESMEEMKEHFRYLARVGNSVWDIHDVRDLEAWARFDAAKERRKKKQQRKEEKEEGEISDRERR